MRRRARGNAMIFRQLFEPQSSAYTYLSAARKRAKQR